MYVLYLVLSLNGFGSPYFSTKCTHVFSSVPKLVLYAILYTLSLAFSFCLCATFPQTTFFPPPHLFSLA